MAVNNLIKMNTGENYLEINRQSWNNKTDTHLKSEFYNLEGFLKGETSLNSIELNLLGNVKGKSILHLQCHFGQDTISLNRLGSTSNKILDIIVELKKIPTKNRTYD